MSRSYSKMDDAMDNSHLFVDNLGQLCSIGYNDQLQRQAVYNVVGIGTVGGIVSYLSNLKR